MHRVPIKMTRFSVQRLKLWRAWFTLYFQGNSALFTIFSYEQIKTCIKLNHSLEWSPYIPRYKITSSWLLFPLFVPRILNILWGEVWGIEKTLSWAPANSLLFRHIKPQLGKIKKKNGTEHDLILPCSFPYLQLVLRYSGSKYLNPPLSPNSWKILPRPFCPRQTHFPVKTNI